MHAGREADHGRHPAAADGAADEVGRLPLQVPVQAGLVRDSADAPARLVRLPQVPAGERREDAGDRRQGGAHAHHLREGLVRATRRLSSSKLDTKKTVKSRMEREK